MNKGSYILLPNNRQQNLDEILPDMDRLVAIKAANIETRDIDNNGDTEAIELAFSMLYQDPNIRMADIASVLNMSRSHFYRLYKGREHFYEKLVENSVVLLSHLIDSNNSAPDKPAFLRLKEYMNKAILLHERIDFLCRMDKVYYPEAVEALQNHYSFIESLMEMSRQENMIRNTHPIKWTVSVYYSFIGLGWDVVAQEQVCISFAASLSWQGFINGISSINPAYLK